LFSHRTDRWPRLARRFHELLAAEPTSPTVRDFVFFKFFRYLDPRRLQGPWKVDTARAFVLLEELLQGRSRGLDSLIGLALQHLAP
jgi:hypothetical protein